MKKLFFSLIAVVAFSINGFASVTVNEVIVKSSMIENLSVLKDSSIIASSVSIQLDETKCYYRIVTRNRNTGVVTTGPWIEYPCGSIMQTKTVSIN